MEDNEVAKERLKKLKRSFAKKNYPSYLELT